MSIVFIGALVLSINFAPVKGSGTLALVLGAIAVVAGIGFFLQQRRAANPLFDLHVAARPTFWVAAVGGLVVFGSLMGAMFIGQQFLQNVLGYSTLAAGAAIIPAALAMVIVAPRSATMIERYGARVTLLAGYLFVVLGLFVALFLWNESTQYWQVALAYALVGIGVGLAGTPASRSLTGSRSRAPRWYGVGNLGPATRPGPAPSCSRFSAEYSRPGTQNRWEMRSRPRRTHPK